MREKKMKYRFEQQAEGNAVKLYIYDDVTAYGDFNWDTWEYDESETSCKYFRGQLAEIPETSEIELHVNSYGGDVKEGIAIYNLLRQHPAHKTCYVDGFAYSIASVICLACDKVIMGMGTSMLIHNMAMAAYGDAATLRKCADDLDVLMEGNRRIYMERAKNLTEEQLEEMMDAETFLTPEQCLEYGFCDEIAGYQADQGRAAQQAAAEIRSLRQELAAMKSFRQEMKQFAPAPKEPEPPREPVNNINQKALHMMGAFLNAFTKKEEE